MCSSDLVSRNRMASVCSWMGCERGRRNEQLADGIQAGNQMVSASLRAGVLSRNTEGELPNAVDGDCAEGSLACKQANRPVRQSKRYSSSDSPPCIAAAGEAWSRPCKTVDCLLMREDSRLSDERRPILAALIDPSSVSQFLDQFCTFPGKLCPLEWPL